MPRPRKVRFVQGETPTSYYKPRGIPLTELCEATLSLDGLEALRHADVDGLDQTEAARRMGISRSTFSRLLAEARTVVATALTRGWALRIEGGPVATAPRRAACSTGRAASCAGIPSADAAAGVPDEDDEESPEPLVPTT